MAEAAARPRPQRPLLAALALSLAGLAPAQEPTVTRITWLAGDVPVVFPEPGKPERHSDRLLAWLEPRLPGIEHVRVVANAKRSWALIERGEEVCRIGAMHSPEREAAAYFSDTWLLPPLQLVVRAEARARLPRDAAGAVDLERLLADASLRGAVTHGRSYGPRLDARLVAAGERSQIQFVTSPDFGSNILTMLLQGRADYSFEFPSALTALVRRQPEVGQLVHLPLKGQDEWMVGGVACPRTPWGHHVIRRVDTALGTPEGAAALRESLRAELPQDLSRPQREALDAFFQRRSRPTPGL